MASNDLVIGPYVVGEKPSPLEYQFLDADGIPLNLTGYTAKFVYRPTDDPQSAGVEASAVITDPAQGQVTYTWTGIELTSPGPHWAQFWVGNTTQRYASLRLTFRVQAAVGSVPSV